MVEALAFWLAGGNEVLALRLVTAFAWAFHAAGAVLVGLIAEGLAGAPRRCRAGAAPAAGDVPLSRRP